jgi:TolB protein
MFGVPHSLVIIVSWPRCHQKEETSWHARPDVSPDGARIVYSSYLGRQWQQLWLLPADGGYPFPLTYGDYDNTNPAWSPDGRTIAFISNRAGNTALWLIDAFSGEEGQLRSRERRYLRPRRELTLQIVDEQGNNLPARISVTDSRQRAYAPDDAWIHADDLLVRERQPIESRYFHGRSRSRISVPLDRLAITVSHGPAYEIAHLEEDTRSAGWPGTRTVTLKRLPAFEGSSGWWSGDLHVHMNYGGLYRNTPSRLADQGQAEDLNLIYNLVVNKEQRFPDVAAFRPDPDPASSDRLLILHGQEFHTSYWGHLSILNLKQHLMLPGYAAYPFTAAASPYPHNATVADMAHLQDALVGYAHPFDEVLDPGQGDPLTNALPIDAALGKIDYYEAVGFSDHKATNAIWYRLLECGLAVPAGAGTDAMANYASLRGPVGLNRIYVPANGSLTRESFLAGVKQGRGTATNGALLQLNAGAAAPGDTVQMPAAGTLRYRASLRSNVPVDIYPYATTSPIYVHVGGKPRRSADAAAYFLRWIDRIQAATERESSYRARALRTSARTAARSSGAARGGRRPVIVRPLVRAALLLCVSTMALEYFSRANARALQPGSIHEPDVAVPMRAGVVLRADVLRPSEGRFPTLAYRTP